MNTPLCLKMVYFQPSKMKVWLVSQQNSQEEPVDKIKPIKGHKLRCICIEVKINIGRSKLKSNKTINSIYSFKHNSKQTEKYKYNSFLGRAENRFFVRRWVIFIWFWQIVSQVWFKEKIISNLWFIHLKPIYLFE